MSCFEPRLRPTAVFALLSLLAVVPATFADADEEPVPPPTAGVVAFDQGIEAVLPGRLLALTNLEDGTLAVLIRSDDEAEGRSQILRLDATAGSPLETLLVSDEKLESLRRAPGDGAYRLLAASKQRLIEIPLSGGEPRILLEEPGVDPSDALDRGLLPDPRAGLLVARVAGTEIWSPTAGSAETLEAGRYQRRTEAELPVTVRRRRHGLELRTPRPRLLEVSGEEGAPDTSRVFVGPEREGAQRLRMLEVIPDAATTAEPSETDEATAGENSEESNPGLWAQLPRPEDVAESWLLDADGRALLAVATTNAEKLGIFEKLALRVFPLRADRTRAGVGPSLAVTTATRNWYEIDLEIVDLDGDGRDDLAVFQPEGLGAGDLVIDVYRGKGTGGFFRQPRSSKIETSSSKWRYGDDLDGDGQPDLLLVDGSRVLLYSGADADHKKRVLAKNPRVLLETSYFDNLPAVLAAVDEDERSRARRVRGRPLWIDLGDGRHVLGLRASIRGRSVLRLVDVSNQLSG